MFGSPGYGVPPTMAVSSTQVCLGVTAVLQECSFGLDGVCPVSICDDVAHSWFSLSLAHSFGKDLQMPPGAKPELSPAHLEVRRTGPCTQLCV